jgi:hypothetical protein
MHLVDQPSSTFTTQELARLAVYRAAVAAGFYSDWDGSAESTDADVLAWLPHAQNGLPAAYPFTADERRRLEQCRAALAAGTYADDAPAFVTNATGDESGR